MERPSVENSIPARRNSARRSGMSKRAMPYPARSQLTKKVFSAGAISSNVLFPATSSSVMWWTSVASGGMGTPGLTRQLACLACPVVSILQKAISTMRSLWGLGPVDSKSSTTNGRPRLISAASDRPSILSSSPRLIDPPRLTGDAVLRRARRPRPTTLGHKQKRLSPWPGRLQPATVLTPPLHPRRSRRVSSEQLATSRRNSAG